MDDASFVALIIVLEVIGIGIALALAWLLLPWANYRGQRQRIAREENKDDLSENPRVAQSRADSLRQPSDDVSRILLEILQIGLLRIREFGQAGLAEACAIEADHLHNIPALIQSGLRPELLDYYVTVERELFQERAKSDVLVFMELWARLDEAIAKAFIRAIKTRALSQKNPLPLPPVSESELAAAEHELGFKLPALLRACYLEIGNGGFGPGYGIMRLPGGSTPDLETLVGYYRGLLQDPKVGWKRGLLPFCEWGCAMYACVDCAEPGGSIYHLEYTDVAPCGYSIEEFFRMWIEGVHILAQDQGPSESVEIINPFTQKPGRVFKRRPK